MGKLTKVISGGQTGVDQAALRAARGSGLKIGGWCPPGRACEAGVIPLEYPLKETPSDRSVDSPDVPRSQRTEWNVRDSDGALVIQAKEASRPPSPGFGVAGRDAAPGVEWTIECANRYGRPLLICDLDDRSAREQIEQWVVRNQIRRLNVAGPSESAAPGIGERAYALLRAIFERL